jgi:hypothetical protein
MLIKEGHCGRVGNSIHQDQIRIAEFEYSI